VSERPPLTGTWAPKGQTPVIPSAAVWTSYTCTGLVVCTPSGGNSDLMLTFQRGSVKSSDFVKNLKRFKREWKRRYGTTKLILFVDGLAAHWSKEAKEWLATQTDWLEMHPLPPYAPDLNPVEYLWSVGKARDLANMFVDAATDVPHHIWRFKRRVKRARRTLQGFLKHSGLFNRELK
jgi:transposase